MIPRKVLPESTGGLLPRDRQKEIRRKNPCFNNQTDGNFGENPKIIQYLGPVRELLRKVKFYEAEAPVF